MGGDSHANASDPPNAAVVIRFSPGPDEPKKLRDELKYVDRRFRQDGGSGHRYRLSVFASEPGTSTRLEHLQSLVDAAGLSGIRLEDERNRLIWTSTAGDLRDRGFEFVKDGYPEERAEHYSVDLGQILSGEAIKKFADAFDGSDRAQWKDGVTK